MRQPSLSVIACIAIMALSLVGCGRSVDWDSASQQERQSEAVDKRTVLFAPVALGPLAEAYPEGRTEYASNLATKVNQTITDARAWASRTLPGSDNEAWTAGPVGAAAGAHLVVLTEVTNIEESRGGAVSAGLITAQVRMRAFNAIGQEVWFKNVEGRSSAESSPKFQNASSTPAARAGWEACKKGLSALKDWLNQLPGVKPIGLMEDPTMAGPMIEVAITSIPEGADIIINGDFKGNTPTTLSLPVTPVTVRIQRHGYQVWEHVVEATPEMRIQPALTPVPAPAAK